MFRSSFVQYASADADNVVRFGLDACLVVDEVGMDAVQLPGPEFAPLAGPASGSMRPDAILNKISIDSKIFILLLAMLK
jgi:hypothetical protein